MFILFFPKVLLHRPRFHQRFYITSVASKCTHIVLHLEDPKDWVCCYKCRIWGLNCSNPQQFGLNSTQIRNIYGWTVEKCVSINWRVMSNISWDKLDSAGKKKSSQILNATLKNFSWIVETFEFSSLAGNFQTIFMQSWSLNVNNISLPVKIQNEILYCT